MLHAALEAAAHTPPEGPVPADIAKAERLLTDAHGAAVSALLEKSGLKPGDISLLGFHGQTVLHRPSYRRTWQIGDGAALAQATGIPVVNEFRNADVAAELLTAECRGFMTENDPDIIGTFLQFVIFGLVHTLLQHPQAGTAQQNCCGGKHREIP